MSEGSPLSLRDRAPLFAVLAESGFWKLQCDTLPDELTTALTKLAAAAAGLGVLERAVLREHCVRLLRDLGYAEPGRVLDAALGRIDPPAPATGQEPAKLVSAAVIRDNPDLMRPPNTVLHRLAWTGRASNLAGAHKQSGKSTLIRAAVARYTRGEPFLDGPAVEPGLVVWWSGDREPYHEMISALDEGGADLTRIVFPDRPVRVADISALVREVRPALLVMDTWYACLCMDVPEESSASAFQPVLNGIRDLMAETDVAVLGLQHTPHGLTRGRGSTSVPGYADMLLELSVAKDDQHSRNVVCRGRWECPDWHYRMDETGALTLDDRTAVGVADTLDAKVLDTLRTHPGLSGNAVGGKLKARREDVSVVIGRLAASKVIENGGTDKRPLWRVSGT